ncbi:ASCH domain-containing protein [Levilactobacillus lindianensis]|uniref:ASCH domain-containing protein n=1 Tax=Levilactobacillus lindianensis TaxID=2486018 RepID=UPI001CDB9FE6|nr:ASCH domain-containing protein [Levilactobacillus lindianensis]
MATTQMKLAADQFDLMAVGSKTIEIRLHDPKRQSIQVGDTIRFVNLADASQVLEKRVRGHRLFPTFAALYHAYSPVSVGSQPQMVQATYTIYTIEQERRWGTMAIEV